MLHSTENEEKLNVVERWNRIMKNIMWKYSQKYIDVLPDMVEKYNSTYHRSIKLTPTEARNPAYYEHVHNALCAKGTSLEFHVGDKVHIVGMYIQEMIYN